MCQCHHSVVLKQAPSASSIRPFCLNFPSCCVSVKEMIDEADRDGDGEVNQQEFLRIMKKTCLYWGKRGWFLRVMLLIYLLQTPYYCVVPYFSTLNKVCAVIFFTGRNLFRTWAQRLVKCQIILLWVTWKNLPLHLPKKKRNTQKESPLLFGMLHNINSTG